MIVGQFSRVEILLRTLANELCDRNLTREVVVLLGASNRQIIPLSVTAFRIQEMLLWRGAPLWQEYRVLEGTCAIGWVPLLLRILIYWSSNVVRTLHTFHGVDMRFEIRTSLLLGRQQNAWKYILSVFFCSKISMSRRIPKELLALRNYKFYLFGRRGVVGLQRGQTRDSSPRIFGFNLGQLVKFAFASHMLLLIIVGLQHLVRTCPAASQSFLLPSLMALIVK